MTDHAWKGFERFVGALIGGKRYPANLGEKVDCEGPRFVAQCKNVKRLSLPELSKLALEAEEQGRARGKAGLVAVKHRCGAGYESPTLIVMTAEVFALMHPTEG